MAKRCVMGALAALMLTFGLAMAAPAGAVGVGKMCGGIAGIRCNRGLFCEHRPGACRVADAAGRCVAIPRFCNKIFKPVCGCNGKTFSNDCVRLSARVQLAHAGACK